MRMSKKGWLLGVILMFAFALVGCGGDKAHEEHKPAAVEEHAEHAAAPEHPAEAEHVPEAEHVEGHEAEHGESAEHGEPEAEHGEHEGH